MKERLSPLSQERRETCESFIWEACRYSSSLKILNWHIYDFSDARILKEVYSIVLCKEIVSASKRKFNNQHCF